MTQHLNIKIEAFGAVSRMLPPSLSIQHLTPCLITEILTEIIRLYPESTQSVSVCACAIGADIVPRQMMLSQDTTLVLLSPVAGG